MRKVISASRRTELVAHYPDYMVERLRRVGVRNIHTVVVWTKNPANMLSHGALREALSEVGQIFVQWTVTGLGGTFVEPNVPPAHAQLALVDDIVALVGDPRRIHWRYDPLVSALQGGERVSNIDLGVFRPLADAFARAGVPAVHTSFATMYRKVVRRLSAGGIEMEDLPADARGQFLADLADAAGERGMQFMACCEPATRPADRPGVGVRGCIDGDLLAALHPANEPCRTDRARGQRALCGCTVSLDIGHYLPCPNRCLYCYARPAEGPAAEHG